MEEREFKVDFFIIGAPSSGTTSLAFYLSEHKQIVFSSPKEPKYLSRLLYAIKNHLTVKVKSSKF